MGIATFCCPAIIRYGARSSRCVVHSLPFTSLGRVRTLWLSSSTKVRALSRSPYSSISKEIHLLNRKEAHIVEPRGGCV